MRSTAGRRVVQLFWRAASGDGWVGAAAVGLRPRPGRPWAAASPPEDHADVPAPASPSLARFAPSTSAAAQGVAVWHVVGRGGAQRSFFGLGQHRGGLLSKARAEVDKLKREIAKGAVRWEHKAAAVACGTTDTPSGQVRRGGAAAGTEGADRRTAEKQALLRPASGAHAQPQPLGAPACGGGCARGGGLRPPAPPAPRDHSHAAPSRRRCSGRCCRPT
jgi:hypothetical protein